MPKPKLPDYLRARIKHLFLLQHSNVQVMKLVRAEGLDYVGSKEELLRCISSLKATVAKKREVPRPTAPKPFDTKPYFKIIKKLDDSMPGKELERLCRPIGKGILENCEKFTRVSDGPPFRGTPFDFFGFKEGRPYAIEFKASLNNFNYPGETQKMRLQELKKRIGRLNIALLQIKVREGKYRMFYNEEMDILFCGPKAPFAPIESWIISRLKLQPKNSFDSVDTEHFRMGFNSNLKTGTKTGGRSCSGPHFRR